VCAFASFVKVSNEFVNKANSLRKVCIKNPETFIIMTYIKRARDTGEGVICLWLRTHRDINQLKDARRRRRRRRVLADLRLDSLR